MYLNIPMMKSVQAKLDDVLLTARENLTGIRVIRAFCKEDEELARFRQKNEELTRMQKKSGSISGLTNPLTYVIINFAIIVLIWTGALQVQKGILTQGQVVALYNYMSQILVELIKLANLIVTINKHWQVQTEFQMYLISILPWNGRKRNGSRSDRSGKCGCVRSCVTGLSCRQ